MSTKQQSWMDHLAESDLPADDFTWTEGSNYGLDGFSFDQTLGEGLNHGDLSGLSGPIVSPRSRGMSQLPEGLVPDDPKDADKIGEVDLHDEDAGLNLTEMLSEDEGGLPVSAATRLAASLADLDWLDPTREQDPDRLPKELRPDRPPLNSIPELEEAWGVNRRTDGMNLVPNRDKSVLDYEKSIAGDLPATPGVGKSAQDATWHVKKATRMAHYGETLGAINNYLYANLSEGLAKNAFTRLAADYGLLGKVFVRASAFPGLKNGKWARELRHIARTARYVVTDNPLIATKLGMQMVAEVPWDKALAHYQPRLKAAGYRVASVGDAKKTLQLAFLMGPRRAQQVPDTKPVDVRPADTVTAKAARAALKAAPVEARLVLTRDDTAKARHAARALVAKARAAHLITAGDEQRLLASTASPEALRRATEALARANQVQKVEAYQGTRATERQQVSRDAAWTKLAQAELLATRMKRAQAQVQKMLAAGQLTDQEAQQALAAGSPEQVLKVAADARVKQVQKSGDYHGARVTERQPVSRDAAWTKAAQDDLRVPRMQQVKAQIQEMVTAGQLTAQEAQRALTKVAQDELLATRMQRAQAHVRKMATAGQLTAQEARRALSADSPEQVLKVATAYAHASGTRQVTLPVSKKAQMYEGPQYGTAVQTQEPSRPRTVSASDQAMLKAAKASGIRVAEFQMLATWLRRQMSEGVAGKDLTALLGIRFAAPLQRAGAEMIRALRQEHEGLAGHLYVDAAAYASKTGTTGCEQAASKHRANAVPYVRAMPRCAGCLKANAEGVCTKYGKGILTRLPKNASEFQQRMIHQADAPDQEITAALFNPQEFGLDGSLNVEVSDAPVTEDIGAVLFDGLHLE